MNGSTKSFIINQICSIANMQGFNDNDIKSILVGRGFDALRFDWIKNKNRIQLLSDSELLLVAWVFDKYCDTDNLFGKGRGDNLSYQSIDYRVANSTDAQIGADYIVDCNIIGDCVIGYVPLYVLCDKLSNNDNEITIPISYKNLLDVANIKNVYPDKLNLIKFYTKEKTVIDKHKRLQINGLFMALDSLFSFILLKNNIDNRNYKIPVLVIYDNNKDKYTSYRSFQDKVKENIVKDITQLSNNLSNNNILAYDLEKCSKSIFSYLLNCKTKNYSDVINNIYCLMSNDKLSKPIFSTAELKSILDFR